MDVIALQDEAVVEQRSELAWRWSSDDGGVNRCSKIQQQQQQQPAARSVLNAQLNHPVSARCSECCAGEINDEHLLRTSAQAPTDSGAACPRTRSHHLL